MSEPRRELLLAIVFAPPEEGRTTIFDACTSSSSASFGPARLTKPANASMSRPA
jgi:hypothetical protein